MDLGSYFVEFERLFHNIHYEYGARPFSTDLIYEA
jgi:hypothetical protein